MKLGYFGISVTQEPAQDLLAILVLAETRDRKRAQFDRPEHQGEALNKRIPLLRRLAAQPIREFEFRHPTGSQREGCKRSAISR